MCVSHHCSALLHSFLLPCAPILLLLLLHQVHDIEDLIKTGKRNKACPYFTARHLADSAELVFCPYSYLLDPNIRRATKVLA